MQRWGREERFVPIFVRVFNGIFRVGRFERIGNRHLWLGGTISSFHFAKRNALGFILIPILNGCFDFIRRGTAHGTLIEENHTAGTNGSFSAFANHLDIFDIQIVGRPIFYRYTGIATCFKLSIAIYIVPFQMDISQLSNHIIQCDFMGHASIGIFMKQYVTFPFILISIPINFHTIQQELALLTFTTTMGKEIVRSGQLLVLIRQFIVHLIDGCLIHILFRLQISGFCSKLFPQIFRRRLFKASFILCIIGTSCAFIGTGFLACISLTVFIALLRCRFCLYRTIISFFCFRIVYNACLIRMILQILTKPSFRKSIHAFQQFFFCRIFSIFSCSCC